MFRASSRLFRVARLACLKPLNLVTIWLTRDTHGSLVPGLDVMGNAISFHHPLALSYTNFIMRRGFESSSATASECLNVDMHELKTVSIT